jgi:hypothetical protein
VTIESIDSQHMPSEMIENAGRLSGRVGRTCVANSWMRASARAGSMEYAEVSNSNAPRTDIGERSSLSTLVAPTTNLRH